MPKTRLNTKKKDRKDSVAINQSLIALPGFGLTLIAAEVRRDADSGYTNYSLPKELDALAFTLKGALRLEMMNSNNASLQKYRWLWGSNGTSESQDKLSTWRSRVYIQVHANGGDASEAAQSMSLWSPPSQWPQFLQSIQKVPGAVVLLQVNDVFIHENRKQTFSSLLRTLLAESQLLTFVAEVNLLSTWEKG